MGRSQHDYYLPGINTLASQIRDCVDRHGFTKPGVDNISEKLMLTSDELSEAHEEVRDGKFEIYWRDPNTKEVIQGTLSSRTHSDLGHKPEGFPIEIADAIIRLLDIAEGFEIDIALALSLKMKYNETRPIRHGRKF